MTQAPSIKEALEPCPFCASRPHKGPTKMERCQLHGEPFQMYAIWCPRGHAKIVAADQERSVGEWNTRATLQPDGERREAIARIIHPNGFDSAGIEFEHAAEVEEAFRKADLILASGLVQNEAAIRRDEREKCAKIADREAEFWQDAESSSARIVAANIRSARDGGATCKEHLQVRSGGNDA